MLGLATCRVQAAFHVSRPCLPFRRVQVEECTGLTVGQWGVGFPGLMGVQGGA